MTLVLSLRIDADASGLRAETRIGREELEQLQAAALKVDRAGTAAASGGLAAAGQAAAAAGRSFGTAAAGAESAAGATKAAAAAAGAARADYERLRASLDPIYAAQLRLRDGTRTVSAAQQAGVVVGREAAATLDRLQREYDGARAAAGRLDRGLASQETRFRQAANGAGGLRGQLVALQSAFAAFGIERFTRSVVAAELALAANDNALRTATESAEAQAEAWNFAREVAERYGQRLDVVARQYANFLAATQGQFALEEQQEIFLGLVEAMTALQRSSDDTAGAFNALVQIASKGTLQAEEIRGQLGERLPGAFRIAAEAMGVTQTALSKMLEQGEVVADEFPPRFGRELRRRFGQDAVEASTSLNAALNRLTTDWLTFRKAVSEGGVAEAVRGLADTLRGLAENEEAAASLGAALGGAIEAVAEAAVFAAENLDLIKAALAAIVGVQILRGVQALAIGLGAVAVQSGAAAAALGALAGGSLLGGLRGIGAAVARLAPALLGLSPVTATLAAIAAGGWYLADALSEDVAVTEDLAGLSAKLEGELARLEATQRQAAEATRAAAGAQGELAQQYRETAAAANEATTAQVRGLIAERESLGARLTALRGFNDGKLPDTAGAQEAKIKYDALTRTLEAMAERIDDVALRMEILRQTFAPGREADAAKFYSLVGKGVQGVGDAATPAAAAVDDLADRITSAREPLQELLDGVLDLEIGLAVLDAGGSRADVLHIQDLATARDLLLDMGAKAKLASTDVVAIAKAFGTSVEEVAGLVARNRELNEETKTGLDLLKKREEAEATFQATLDGLERQNEALRLKLADQEELVPLVEMEWRLRESMGRDLLPAEREELRRKLEEQGRLNRAIEEEEERRRQVKRLAEEQVRVAREAVDDVVDFGAKAFKGLFDDTGNAWKRLWENAKDFALDTISRLVADAVLRPILVPIVADFFGGPGGASAIGGAGAGGSPFGGVSPLSFLDTRGLYNQFAFSGLGQSLGLSVSSGAAAASVFGVTAATAPATLALSGPAGGFGTIAGLSTASTGGLVGAAGAGGAAPALTALGAAAPYLLAAAAIALPLLGGLLGGQPSVGPVGVADFSPGLGRGNEFDPARGVDPFTADNGGDGESLRPIAEAIADLIADTADRFSASIDSTLRFRVANFTAPESGSGAQPGFQVNAFLEDEVERRIAEGKTQEQALYEALKFAVTEAFDFDSQALDDAARNITADTTDELLSQLQTVLDFDDITTALRSNSEAITASTLAQQEMLLAIRRRGEETGRSAAGASRDRFELLAELFAAPDAPGADEAARTAALASAARLDALRASPPEWDRGALRGGDGLVSYDQDARRITAGDSAYTLRSTGDEFAGLDLVDDAGEVIGTFRTLSEALVGAAEAAEAAADALQDVDQATAGLRDRNMERTRDAIAIFGADVERDLGRISGSFEEPTIGAYEARLIEGRAALDAYAEELERGNEAVREAAEGFPELSGEIEDMIAASAAAVDQAREDLARNVAADFNQSARDRLQALRDPGLARLVELDRQFQDERAEAERIGGDVGLVTELYRASVEGLAAANDNLAQTLRSTADQAERVVGSLSGFRRQLSLDPALSSGTARERYDYAEARFRELAADAAGGDLTAASQLEEAGRDFLELARVVHGASEEFKADRTLVVQAVDAAIGTAESELGLARDQLTALTSIDGRIEDFLASLDTSRLGDNPARNAILAAASGYTGSFGGGGFQAAAGQYAAGLGINLGARPEINAQLSYVSGYTGDFGGGGFQDYIRGASEQRKEASRIVLRLAGITPGFLEGGYTGGGLVMNGLADRDSVYRVARDEFVVRRQAVAQVGVPALSFINQHGRLPGGETANDRVIRQLGDRIVATLAAEGEATRLQSRDDADLVAGTIAASAGSGAQNAAHARARPRRAA